LKKICKKLSVLGNNKKIWENLSDNFPNPYTIENAQSWIKHNQEKEPQENFAIMIQDEFIGIIGRKEKEPHITEIGYWIGEPYWWRGYATEALKAFTQHILNTTNYKRIQAKVFTHNPASGKTLRKCGYEYEGTLRKNDLKAEKYPDEELYSITKE